MRTMEKKMEATIVAYIGTTPYIGDYRGITPNIRDV